MVNTGWGNIYQIEAVVDGGGASWLGVCYEDVSYSSVNDSEGVSVL